MAEQNIKTFTFAALSDTNVRTMGSFRGIHLGAALEGVGMTSGDSNYKLVQSIDETNWIDIPGAIFTGLGNEVLAVSLPDVNTMIFVGIQLTAAGTETTGSVTISVSVK